MFLTAIQIHISFEKSIDKINSFICVDYGEVGTTNQRNWVGLFHFNNQTRDKIMTSLYVVFIFEVYLYILFIPLLSFAPQVYYFSYFEVPINICYIPLTIIRFTDD